MSVSRIRIDGNPISTPRSRGASSDSTEDAPSGMRVIRMSRNPRGPVLDSIESEIEMTADDSNPMDDDAVCKRYVVLVAPGEQLPSPLMELLSDRSDDSNSTNVFHANHPMVAIALLSRLEHERRLQEKWELAEQTVLVVVNRDSWKDLSGLFDATRQLMPAVAIWVCAERIAIQIYAGENSDVDGHQAREPGDDPNPEPENRDAHPEAGSQDEESGEPERTTLSSEELQDLLDAFDVFEEDHSEDDQDPAGPEHDKP